MSFGDIVLNSHLGQRRPFGHSVHHPILCAARPASTPHRATCRVSPAPPMRISPCPRLRRFGPRPAGYRHRALGRKTVCVPLSPRFDSPRNEMMFLSVGARRWRPLPAFYAQRRPKDASLENRMIPAVTLRLSACVVSGQRLYSEEVPLLLVVLLGGVPSAPERLISALIRNGVTLPPAFSANSRALRHASARSPHCSFVRGESEVRASLSILIGHLHWCCHRTRTGSARGWPRVAVCREASHCRR